MYWRLNHTTNFELRVKPDATQTQVLNPWVLTFLIFQTLWNIDRRSWGIAHNTIIYDSNLKFSGRCLRFDSANEKSNKKSCPYKAMQDLILAIWLAESN